MRKKSDVLLLATSCIVAVCAVQAQVVPPPPQSGVPALYLLAGAPTPKDLIAYETELYRFDGQQRKLTLVRKLGTREGRGEDPGVEFLLADYEGRMLLAGSPHVTPNRLHIIHMDAPGTPATRELEFSDLAAAPWEPHPARTLATREAAGLRSGDTRASVVWHSLIERPGLGHWLCYELRSGAGTLFVGYAPDDRQRREFLQESDVFSHLRISGTFGLAGLGDSDMRSVQVSQGKVFSDGRLTVDLGIPAPEVQAQVSAWWLMVHNSSITVMYRIKDPATSLLDAGASSLQVFTTKSGRWATFRVPGSFPAVKGIGSWIMGAAAGVPQGRQSPGQSERRQPAPLPPRPKDGPPGRSFPGPRASSDEWFRRSGFYYAGILFLIDAETGRYFEIRTGQGDSEILLVEGNSVYYRVNNRLLRATFQGTSIGPAEVLAQNDAIVDVHWAFMGP